MAGTAISLGQKTESASLPVTLASDQALPLPTGASTAANQATEITHLANLDTNTIHVDTNNVTVVSSALPTGGATSVLQTTGNTSLASIDTKTPALVAGRVPVDGSGVTQPISAASLPLPTGAATSALQTTGNATLTAISGQLPATLGQKASVASLAVVLASDQSPIPTSQDGKLSQGFVRNDYSSVNVTTAAYVQLIASTVGAATEMFIFDSSGQTLKIAFGGIGSEVDQFLVVPGGNGHVNISIPIATRISIRAVSANATVGEVDLNLLG